MGVTSPAKASQIQNNVIFLFEYERVVYGSDLYLEVAGEAVPCAVEEKNTNLNMLLPGAQKQRAVINHLREIKTVFKTILSLHLGSAPILFLTLSPFTGGE